MIKNREIIGDSMPYFKWLLSKIYNFKDPSHQYHRRKYQLIYTLSVEFFFIGFLLVLFNIYLHFWYLTILLFLGTLAILGNIIFLRVKRNIIASGHILTFVAYTICSIGTYWLYGISVSYIGWFYVAPVIAATTLGVNEFILYNLLSALLIIILDVGNFSSVYQLVGTQLILVNLVNHIAILTIISTTLFHLLKENTQFEKLLQDQNYSLSADKDKFHYLSNHDSLTNLPNRSLFFNYLESLVDSIDSPKKSITLFFMDLDGFKRINDLHGHQVGDFILLQTSKKLKHCFRENDMIARLAGDEFTAVITHEANDPIVESILKRIHKEFNKPLIINNNIKIKCTISVGISNFPKDALNTELLMKLADEAMYLNKSQKLSNENIRQE